jgi:hypothetical protein
MSGFLDSIRQSLNAAKTLALDPGVQKWMLVYVFFLASFSTLFSIMGYVSTSNFYLAMVLRALVYLSYFAGAIYFSVRLFSEAFGVLGIRTRDYGLGVLTYVSGIGQNLVAFLLLFNRRLFLTFAFLLILFVGASAYVYFVFNDSLLTIIFLFLLALAAIPYFFFYVYHSTRLGFAQLFYLSGKPFSEALLESWAMVGGRTLHTFGTILAGAVIACLVALPFVAIKLAFTSVVRYWVSHYSVSMSPNLNLFISTLSFPFDFFMFLASTAFVLYFVGVFHYTLSETGRLAEYSKRKTAGGRRKAKKRS